MTTERPEARSATDPKGRVGPSDVDTRMMARALELASRGWGQVAPNPLVGAVAARGDEIVGEGYHASFGDAHAEIVALREAGDRARGATLYATLEPCAHQGKTPPCCRSIAEAGIRRVVIACADPNPESGQGADDLRKAGIEVEIGVGAEEGRRQNAPFLWSQSCDTPFTALKLALSLDGKLSDGPGVRTAISGVEAEAEVHRLRAGYDAVLVGGRTAIVDDPLLTVRGDIVPRRPPIRVVLDPDLRLSTGSRLVQSAEDTPLWMMGAVGVRGARRSALERPGVRVTTVRRGPEGGLDLPVTWRGLWRGGLQSVLVEGGGRLAGALLDERLVQCLHLFYASRFIGPDGVEGFPGLSSALEERWRVIRRQDFGEDTLITLEAASLWDILEAI
jgi:diaminohydroxyphosphoribosylaminopyrimidine deaminase/5-amino-6-(5-phosphoribosylamino)uracil reductase